MRTLPLLLALLPTLATAVPLTLSQQGRLLDSTGVPLDGVTDLQLALYDEASGSAAALWSENQTVDLDQGFYSVVLGDDATNALDSELFTGDGLYLGIVVAGTVIPERVRLTSAPSAIVASYALNAEQAQSATAADTATTAINVDGGSVSATEIAVNSVVIVTSEGKVPFTVIEGAPQLLGETTCAEDQLLTADASGGWACIDAPEPPDLSAYQERVSGTCSVGQAITAINADGTVSCGAVDPDLNPEPSANLAGPAQTSQANVWSGFNFDGATLGEGITVSGNQLFFAEPGVYKITVNYRGGSGNDVWTGLRLWGDESVRGASAGYGVNGGSSPELFSASFLASVVNIGAPYEIQLGRRGAGQGLASPSAILGQTLPAVVATVDRVDGLERATTSYAELQANAQVFQANSWSPVTWSRVALAQGIATRGEEVRFSEPGVYQIDLSYRLGSGGDVWTSAALFEDDTQVGHSGGYGNLTSSHELFHVSFLAEVSDPSKTHTIRFGRLGSNFSTDNPALIDGFGTPSINGTITKVEGDHLQAEGPGQNFAANAWTGVEFADSPASSGVSVSGTDLTFTKAGLYRATLTYRAGTGPDVWTGARVVDEDGATIGVSAGYGNYSGSPEGLTSAFLINVDDPSKTHTLQVGRANGSQTVINTSSIDGVSLAAVQATFVKID